MASHNPLHSHFSSNITETFFMFTYHLYTTGLNVAEKLFLDEIYIHLSKAYYLLLCRLAGLSNNQLKALRLKKSWCEAERIAGLRDDSVGRCLPYSVSLKTHVCSRNPHLKSQQWHHMSVKPELR